jgi:hypothetical protein
MLNVSLDVYSSRRDDLESLGYVLIYLAVGHLPWFDTGNATIESVGMVKESTPLDELCRGLPDQFIMYMEYVRSLGYSTKPDYSYLRSLFGKIANENKFKV